MLQDVLVKRIERIYRLRLVYGAHLALYAVALTAFLFTYRGDSTDWPGMFTPLVMWLPIVLIHTALQSFYELRERCISYAPVPLENFNRYVLPIDIYDEQGNRIERKREIELLPRPRQGEF